MNAIPAFNQLIHGFKSIRIPNGALGAAVDIQIPINEIWSPISLYFTLNCSAAVGNRFLIFVLGDTPNYGYRYQDSHAIVADQIRKINLFQGATPETPADINASWQFPLPINSFVGYPNNITLGFQGFDVNDQFTGININTRTWLSI